MRDHILCICFVINATTLDEKIIVCHTIIRYIATLLTKII